MDSTSVRGKDLLINRSSVSVYDAFTDLRRFADGLPEEYKNQVSVDCDSITANIKGFNLGIRINKKIPYSLISFKEDGQAPFPFTFEFHIEMVGLESTLFHIELSAQLNTMMKMMIGNKLQELVDKLTEQIEKSLG
jgi:carbon monoxide dehydrogenase subunit G